MTLYFPNPGEADIRTLTTFGVNVKEKANPIGRFGTGFKYAVAVILRLGGSIVVYIGTDKYEFVAREAEIRGKGFSIVSLIRPDDSVTELGFTTELGKDWEPWMAYRELRCNQADEGGGIPTVSQIHEQTSGMTTVVVRCGEVETAHHESWKYFLEGRAIESLEEVDVHYQRNAEEPGREIFYRGVRVGKFDLPTLFTYNFTAVVRLTEDRTILYPHEVQRTWLRSLAHSNNEALIRKVLTSPKDFAESKLDFSQLYGASEKFLDIAAEYVKNPPENMAAGLRTLLSRCREVDPYEWVDPNVLQAQMLIKAEAFCKDLGYDTGPYEIRIVRNLGYGVLGQVHGNSIYLSEKVFNMGTKMVAGTLLEEAIHLRERHGDESRAMQNHLLDLLVTQYEMRRGEPL